MNKIFIVLFLVLVGLILRGYVLATNDVCFCHNVNNNPHTICTSNQGQINGHTAHVNNGTDYEGECRVDVHSSPTPTVGQVTETPTPTIKADDPTSTPEATLSPIESPTNTVVPTEGLTRSFTSDFSKPKSTNQVPTGGGEPEKGIWK